jgi:thiol-disulfide isomerase/thioredoxin
MRSACAPVIAGLLLACGPKASTQPPGEASGAAPASEGAAATGDATTSDATAGDAAAGTNAADGAAGGAPAAEATEPEPAAAGISSSTLTLSSNPEGLAAADGGEAPASPEEGSADPPDAGSETEPTVAKLELPKPLHGKLDVACGNDPGVGEKLKAFSLPGIEGDEPVTQGTFRGRVLVVNFWGTWCKPCLKELPEFDRRYRKHGMTLLAIATDEDAKAVADMVAERKWGAKIAIAGEKYAEQYGSSKFPFTLVVDHKGVIRASYRGYKPECMGQLEADIREQLTVRADAKAKRKKG